LLLKPTVFYFCRLGDMVMLTPALKLLHTRYGRPCQVIGTGTWTGEMYEGHPDVSDVWSFHRHLPFVLDTPWRSLRRALRESHPGPIYVCEQHYRQLPRIRRMLQLSGIDPRRCVYPNDQPLVAPEHLVDRLVRLALRTPDLLRASDYLPPSLRSIDGPRLHVLAHERRERDDWLKSLDWYGRELILLQPGNHRTMGWRRDRWRRRNTDDKWWPLERWVKLLGHVHEVREEAVLVLCGSITEVPMLEQLRAAAQLPRLGLFSGTLRQLFALCEAGHSMISVDTGPAHVAGALGLPIVVLFGAQPAEYWLPRTRGSAAVGVGGPPRSTRVDQISVDEVVTAWHTVIDRRASGQCVHADALEFGRSPA